MTIFISLLPLLPILAIAQPSTSPPSCASKVNETTDPPYALAPDSGSPEKRSLSVVLNGKSLTVNYRRYASPGSSKTIIFLCGGPGQCNYRPKEVPPGFNVITFDPIGMGENYSQQMSPEDKSVESQGQVVKALAKGLNSNDYMIMGQSFGTAGATVGASLIAKEKMPQPNSVILEDTLGPRAKAFRDWGGVSTKGWNAMPPEDRERFKKQYDKFLSENPSLKTDFILDLYTLIGYGPLAIGGTLQKMANSDFSYWKNWIKTMNQVRGYDSSSVAGKSMYQAAGCQAIRHLQDPSTGGKWLFDPSLNIVNGNLDDKDHCPCRTIDRDYDPCQFQITAPILYFGGESDPMTPAKGVQQHFDCQKTKNKVIVTDPGWGHQSLQDPRIEGCLGTIFDAAESGHVTDMNAHINLSTGCALQGNPFKASGSSR